MLSAGLDDPTGDVTLTATLRGLPFQSSDRVQWSFDGPSTVSAAVNVYYSAASSRYFTYAGPFIAFGGTFEFAPATYHDIAVARVSGAGGAALTLRAARTTGGSRTAASSSARWRQTGGCRCGEAGRTGAAG